MRIHKLHERLHVLLWVALGFLAVDTALLGWIAWHVTSPAGTAVPAAAGEATPQATGTPAPDPASAPADPTASTPTPAPTGTQPGAAPATATLSGPQSALVARLVAAGDPYSMFLAATLQPLERAATDMGLATADLLPTEKEIDAAVASGSPDSAASKKVLEKLKAGYAKVNMPFPEVKISRAATPSAPPAPTAPTETTTVTTPAAPGTVSKDILQAYFNVTRDRLKRAAKVKNTDVTAWLPSEEDVQAAVGTSRVDSDASRKVLDQLRAGYEAVGSPFPEPMLGQ